MAHFYIRFDPLEVCRAIIDERLHFLDAPFNLSAQGTFSIQGELSAEKKSKIDDALKPYGITIRKEVSNSVVAGIKIAVEELLSSPEARTEKISVYLSEKLGYSYSSLSNRFSEETHTSIENFVILQRIEHVKRLMLQGGISLTEIAQKLDYSSVGHLSRQFKKTTGLTPTIFLRIIEKRKLN